MKKIITFALSVLMAFSLLAGCGQNSSSSVAESVKLEGTLEEILAKVYDGVTDLPMTMEQELTEAVDQAERVCRLPGLIPEGIFTHFASADEEAGVPNPSIRVGFDLDYDQTTILSYGFHAGRYDREGGSMIQGFSIPDETDSRYGRTFYLLVVGEDVENMTIGGYVTGGTDPDTQELEGCGVTVERYKSDLDTMLREILTPVWEERSQDTYQQDGAEPILERVGLDKHLDAVIGTTLHSPRKPERAFTESALAILGTAPEETLGVGDSPYDYKAARVCGLDSALVATGGDSSEFLSRECPETVGVFRDFRELAKTVFDIDL